jgi:hypothetical protein
MQRWREAAGNSPLQLMYGIDGRAELAEETLDHLMVPCPCGSATRPIASCSWTSMAS